MIIYSEVLKKEFDTVEACEKAEQYFCQSLLPMLAMFLFDKYNPYSTSKKLKNLLKISYFQSSAFQKKCQ